MSRLVVLGGFGFFGSEIVRCLRAFAIEPHLASRRTTADLRIDVEDPASIRRALEPGDVVVDAVGPFQTRSTVLVEAAIEVGFHVVDLADALGYVQRVQALEPRIAASDARILTACSALSAVTAALVDSSGVPRPRRVTVFLAPATRHTANPGSAESLMHSVGRPILVLADGELGTTTGWRDSRRFALPDGIGKRRGFRIESVDAVTLTRAWPSLATVELFVDGNVPGFNSILSVAARSPLALRALAATQRIGLGVARALGSRRGELAVEIEGADGARVLYTLVARERAYLTAVAPAVLAARALTLGQGTRSGGALVDAHRQVDPVELLRYLARLGIQVARTNSA